MESLSLPSALTQQAMEDAKLTDEDIRTGDEAVEAALATAERGFKLPEALRSQLLDRLDLEAKVPLYDSAISGLSVRAWTNLVPMTCLVSQEDREDGEEPKTA